MDNLSVVKKEKKAVEPIKVVAVVDKEKLKIECAELNVMILKLDNKVNALYQEFSKNDLHNMQTSIKMLKGNLKKLSDDLNGIY
jgi:hypothetical protein